MAGSSSFDAQTARRREVDELRRRVAELEATAARAELAERALAESRERYQALMEQAGDAIFVAEADSGRVIDCNQKAEELLGRPRREIIGLHQTELHPPEAMDHVRAEFNAAAGHGGPQRAEGPVLRADGSIRQVEIAATVHELEGKRLVQGIFRDITDKRAAERAVRESEARYRYFIASSLQGIFCIKVEPPMPTSLPVDGQMEWMLQHASVEECNNEYARMYGFSSAAEVVGRPIIELVAGDRDVGRAVMRQWIEQNYAFSATETREITKDGRQVWFLNSVISFVEHGRVARIWGTQLDITRRKQTETALRRSQEELASIFRAAPVGIGLVGNRVLLNVNDRICAMTGYSAEELIGQSARILYPSQAEFDWVGQEKYRQIGEHGTGTVETRWRRKDGGMIDVLLSSTPLDTGDPSAGVTFTALDITERKRAEHELRRNEHFLQDVFDSIRDGISVLDIELNVVRTNRWMEEMYAGQLPLSGRKCYEVYQCRESPCPWCPSRRAMETGDAHTEIVPYPTVDEPTGWIELSAFPIKDEQGRVVNVIEYVKDITDRRRIEQALRESERALSTLMSNLPGMAYRCRNDEQWTMVFVSDGCRALTGYAAQDLVGNRAVSYGELIHPDDRDDVRSGVDAALEQRGPFELSYRIRTANGAERWLWERGRGVFGDDGKLLFLEGFIFDVTERHIAEQEREKLEVQLRQAQKMEAIGQLAGGVAHDFNNILTAVFGNVDLVIAELEARHPAAARPLHSVRQIEKCAQRAAALTRQLLAFSRRQVMRPEVVDLNDTLRELEKMLRRLITENIRLHLHCAPDLHAVRVDPGQLEQVIVNLVVNARDAMPDGGELTVETRNLVVDEAYTDTHPEAQIGPHVVLAVSDTGCGMDRETRERIFEPFFTTKPEGQGTGLGLSTVYGIVKQAGGNIAVYSEPGRGSTFKIYLPAVHEAAVRPQRVEAPSAAPAGTETIMICEDDVAVRELTALVLRDAGYAVLVAANAGDALQQAASHPGRIDLLVADVIMPDMNGRKLADALHTLRPDLLTLFVSGYTSNVIAHHGVLDENVEFLEKPFSRRQLLLRVRDVLDRAGRGG